MLSIVITYTKQLKDYSMLQSKKASLIEACFSVIIGFIIAFAFWPVVCWINGIPYTHQQGFGVTATYTVVSLIRGYFVRRYFNARLKRAANSIAANYS
jgi:predicted PurR-regulated permease PerM